MTPPTQQCQLLLKTKKLIHITETHQKEERMEAEGRNPIYVSLEREGAIRILSYSGKIEGSDYHGEGLRKILYQAYHMLKKVKSVDMLTLLVYSHRYPKYSRLTLLLYPSLSYS
jgi:hypothetical protein